MSKSWSTCTLLCLNSKNAAQKVCHTQASYQTTKLILVQNYPRQLKYQRNIHYIFNSAATSCKENKFFNDIVKVKAYQYNLLDNFSTLNKAYSKGECSVRRLMTHSSPFCTSAVHYYTIHKPPTFIQHSFFLSPIFKFDRQKLKETNNYLQGCFIQRYVIQYNHIYWNSFDTSYFDSTLTSFTLQTNSQHQSTYVIREVQKI